MNGKAVILGDVGAFVLISRLGLTFSCASQVSLGGKSKGKAAESKQAFVQRTNKEREEREALRRRERASLRVQV